MSDNMELPCDIEHALQRLLDRGFGTVTIVRCLRKAYDRGEAELQFVRFTLYAFCMIEHCFDLYVYFAG